MTDIRVAIVSRSHEPELGELETSPDKPLTPDRGAGFSDADFAVVLLQALTTMAARSKRRQADLTAALRGADIAPDMGRVRNALKLLYMQGAIENLVPLSDGGLLLSVTQYASERTGSLPQWLPLDVLDITGD